MPRGRRGAGIAPTREPRREGGPQGNRTIGTTLDISSHVAAHLRDEAAEKIDARPRPVLGGRDTTARTDTPAPRHQAGHVAGVESSVLAILSRGSPRSCECPDIDDRPFTRPGPARLKPRPPAALPEYRAGASTPASTLESVT